MQQIYLDDYRLHSLTTELPTQVDRGVEGLEAPEQRIDAYDTPGTDGQTIANVLHGGRFVTLEGRIRGNSESEYRTNRALFHQLVGVSRDSMGRIVPRVLRLTDNVGTHYQLSCVVRALKNPDEHPTHSRFQLQLVATDFRLYAQSEQSTTITLPISGGVTFPYMFPVRFGASTGGSAVITNRGTTSTPPVVRFYGPMVNPSISNLTTGQKVQLDMTLVAGDVITLDMARRTVIQGETTNRMSVLESGSRFWQLRAADNYLSFQASEYDAGYVTVTWRDAFTGI